MKLHTHLLRVTHRWIGLIIGIQFLLWTLSGAMMAFLPMDEVVGGEQRQAPQVRTTSADRWPEVRDRLGGKRILGLSLKPLLDRQVYELSTADGVRLFDAESGEPIQVDADLARRIASAAYLGDGDVKRVASLKKLTLAVREHQLPIWRVDFDDERNSSFYVSASTGSLLERRNDSWRLWDFFWMLHNMDYVNRTSFNHPLIVMIGFASVWLAVTGVYLLVRTGWRSDFKRIRCH